MHCGALLRLNSFPAHRPRAIPPAYSPGKSTHMKLLLHQQLAQAGELAKQLRQPAGFRYRMRGSLAQFQGWLDKVARRSRPAK